MADTDTDDDDTLELGVAADVDADDDGGVAPGFDAQPAASYDDDAADEDAPAPSGMGAGHRNAGDDELVLGGEAEADDDAPAAYAPVPRSPLVEKPAAGGGTLFERMSRLSRGGSASGEAGDDDDDPDSDGGVDIPRFLNRQNNQ